jgi:hypothetical protein
MTGALEALERIKNLQQRAAVELLGLGWSLEAAGYGVEGRVGVDAFAVTTALGTDREADTTSPVVLADEVVERRNAAELGVCPLA